MPLIDPRNFDEADMQSAKIGGQATKRPQDKSMQKVIVQHVETGEQIEALRQNVHDLSANGYKLIGPVPQKVGKLEAAAKVEASGETDETGETDDENDGDSTDDENDGDSTDDEKATELNELDVLRQEADALGIKYHPNSGKRKLMEAIALARAQTPKI